MVGLRLKKNLEYMKFVLDRMRVVNVGAAHIMIILTASTSSSDHSGPVIFSLFNDEKGASDNVSESTFANPISSRVSDSRWRNPEKRDSDKCITFEKWNAVREGTFRRFPIMDAGASAWFQWN